MIICRAWSPPGCRRCGRQPEQAEDLAGRGWCRSDVIDVDAVIANAEGGETVALRRPILTLCGHPRVAHQEMIRSPVGQHEPFSQRAPERQLRPLDPSFGSVLLGTSAPRGPGFSEAQTQLHRRVHSAQT